MTAEDPRKAYWNEKYFEYWKSRVEEAGHGKSMIVEGDSNTEDDSVYQRVLILMPLRLAHSSKLAVHGVVCSPSILLLV